MQNTPSSTMTQAPLKNDANQQGWNEIQELLQQTQQENHFMRQQMEILRHENRVLKDRMKTIDSDTQVSKTDSEKAILLGLDGNSGLEERVQGGAAEAVEESSTRDSSYIIADHTGELVLPGFPSSSSDGSVVLPDEPSNMSDGNWDILSSDGEGSMANLHDRILQMEENHYTVNEELQATLQELKDLQDQVTDLTLDTDKLSEEKSMIIEALYRQMSKTEKMNMVVQHFKGICDEQKIDYNLEELNDSSPRTAVSDQASGMARSKEEQEKLTILLKEHNSEIQSEVDKLKYQLLEMEGMLRGALAARKSLEQEITVFKGKLSSLEVEREKGETLLRAEKDKINQLFRYSDPKGILDLPQLLEDGRLKTDTAESRCEELARALEESNNHAEKLQEELERIEDEFESSKNHFEEQVERYQVMIRELDTEKAELETELINLKETVIELEETVERQEYDKQQHLSTIADLNQAVQTLREEKQNMGRDLIDLKRTSARDSEEWVQFQRDLQKAVVIANDYRNEAQNEVKMLEKDKGELHDQIKSLSAEVERLRKIERTLKPPTPTSPAPPRSTPTENEIRQRMQAIMKSSEKDIVRGSTSRKTLSNGKVSVKNIIKSLENNAGADAPKAPTSPTGTSPVPMNFTSNTRPPMERRNTTIAITKSMNSKPLYTRRATTTIITTHDAQKLSMSTSGRAIDDSMIGRSRSQPSNRNEARQMIGDALTRSRDFSTRRSTPSGRDTSESPTARRAKSLCNEPISSGRRSSSSSSLRDSCDSPTPRDSVGNQSPTARKTTEGVDPLSMLVKYEGGGSKRNALLKWCQARTHGYKGVEVTNFSSSWNDGLAFCAIIHSYMPEMIPWNELNNQDKKRNFTVAFVAGESIEISSILDIDDMVRLERPDWKSVMTYVTALYKHFET
ncbi:cytospin-A [Strongylocentrotus purpuratus]|uniref:Calponin-homology (CH) domain-containing protein n=1 Tax=Strongylocentrotus purpuratus TaxID=7668 RepID=A0A7M7HDK7_STRPU|nr:cytospin-A [Strongylocentrotus purpuratus]XP_011665981.2 cytospin-A [Strongylocentrotus purpuratus]XP_788398.4 cytospin-A [Strongylocentrotus purpuratus]